MDFDYGAPGNQDILDILAGGVTPKPQVQANALRTKPVRTSTSITQNVAEQAPSTPAAPQGAAQIRSQLGTQAWGDIQKAQDEIDKYTGPQDYTQMQDYAKERAGQGRQSLLLSLAAQTAGKEYAPVGAAYLKRAMEMREPLKTATGFIDETGQHIEDPQAKAEQRLKLAQARMSRAEQILQSNASAEEKAAAQAEQLAMRREMMQQTMALRQMAMGTAAEARNQRQQQGNWRIEDQMRGDFERQTKNYREGLDAAQNTKQAISSAAGRKLNNVEQQAVITLFNKFLDPGSVVREGEFNRMAQGQGLFQRVQNLVPKIMEGSIVSPQMIQEINNVATLYENAALQRLQREGANFGNVAQQRGLDINAVIPDSRFRPQSAASPADAGPPQGAVRVRGAPTAAAPTGDVPPPGAVRVKGQ